MKSHLSATSRSRYLLPRVMAIGMLIALMGCNPDQDTEDTQPPPADPAPAESMPEDSRSNYTGDRTAANPAQPTDRDQSVDETTSEAAANAQYSLVKSAIAQVRPTSLGKAEGTVSFSPGQDNQDMKVKVSLEGLEPGDHGLHIHEVGDCSADDASSAGDHFNPYDTTHGSPEAAEHHVGDMGNIKADDDGRVDTELTFEGLAFSGPASILQKAVVIHKGEDDLETQPDGDAGDRVGCGVIRIDRQVQAK